MENKKTKIIAYDYMFNYFGGDTYDGKIVTGASITLAIRCYQEGTEVKFDEDNEQSVNLVKYDPKRKETVPTDDKKYLNEVFDVSFDRKDIFKIRRNLYIDNLFRLICGYDRIEYNVIGYSFDVAVGLLKDTDPSLAKDLPAEFQDLPVCEPVEVDESVFREFISSRIDDFDISDNKIAQCPSVRFLDDDYFKDTNQ